MPRVAGTPVPRKHDHVLRRHRPYRWSPRPRSPRYRLARRSGHLVVAVIRAAPTHPLRACHRRRRRRLHPLAKERPRRRLRAERCLCSRAALATCCSASPCESSSAPPCIAGSRGSSFALRIVVGVAADVLPALAPAVCKPIRRLQAGSYRRRQVLSKTARQMSSRRGGAADIDWPHYQQVGRSGPGRRIVLWNRTRINSFGCTRRCSSSATSRNGW
jgi:hypothetical protein